MCGGEGGCLLEQLGTLVNIEGNGLLDEVVECRSLLCDKWWLVSHLRPVNDNLCVRGT